MYLRKLKIGNVELENNIILAPMAGITDKSFRMLCKENGPGLVYTEMVSARAIYHDDERTKKMINIEGEKGPIAIQIFGNEPEIMAEAVKWLNDKANIIDINMGCPAPKVVKNGDGSKLLLDLNLAEKIIESVMKVANVPITVKMRKGWDKDNIVAIELAKIAEKLGVSAVTVHGRTREDFYSGTADWDIIKSVKQSVNIPVIGNGDIFSEDDARKMFEYTGVDGIMCARGTLGNPWLFKKIITYLKTGEKLPDINKDEILATIIRHLELLIIEKGEYTAIREMRKHISWYIKNMPNSSRARDGINKIEDKDELIKYLSEYFQC